MTTSESDVIVLDPKNKQGATARRLENVFLIKVLTGGCLFAFVRSCVFFSCLREFSRLLLYSL